MSQLDERKYPENSPISVSVSGWREEWLGIRLGGGLPRSAVGMTAAPVGHTDAIPIPSEGSQDSELGGEIQVGSMLVSTLF